MRYEKSDLIARLGEPAETSNQQDPRRPGSVVRVMRWDCGCAAARAADEPLWTWDGSDCAEHAGGLKETLENAQAPESDFD